jgi:hypothetical protein
VSDYLPPPPRPPQPDDSRAGNPSAGSSDTYSRLPKTSNTGPKQITKSSEEYLREKASAMSKPALIGYITAALIFIFGGIGTMFNDDIDIGGLKKNIAGTYTFAAIVLVLLSSISDSADRISRR